MSEAEYEAFFARLKREAYVPDLKLASAGSEKGSRYFGKTWMPEGREWPTLDEDSMSKDSLEVGIIQAMKTTVILALALIFGNSCLQVAAANARAPQSQTMNKSAVEPKKTTPKEPGKKKMERKPDGTLGYRYTCSPSGFGQMGKCW